MKVAGLCSILQIQPATINDEVLADAAAPNPFARAAREAVKRLGIDIRVGIHTGGCELQGRSLTGMAMHVAARIQGLASPGDILVSSTVKDVLVGSDARFEDRGQHSLKGMPGEWRLFSLVD